jgi:hypothetical protein
MNPLGVLRPYRVGTQREDSRRRQRSARRQARRRRMLGYGAAMMRITNETLRARGIAHTGQTRARFGLRRYVAPCGLAGHRKAKGVLVATTCADASVGGSGSGGGGIRNDVCTYVDRTEDVCMCVCQRRSPPARVVLCARVVF